MNFVLQRLLDYGLKRLQEPSTWIGIITLVATQFHWSLDPAVQAQLTQIGLAIGGLLFILCREGRNKPDNPSLPTVIRGYLPEAEPKSIVPAPSTVGMQPVANTDKLAVSGDGVVHTAVPSDAVPDHRATETGRRPIRPDYDP